MPDLQYAPISASSLGDNIIIHGDSTFTTIQVVGMYFQCNIVTTLYIKGGSTSLTGSMSFNASGGLNLPNTGSVVYYQVNDSDNLIIHLSGLTGQVGGAIMYYQF